MKNMKLQARLDKLLQKGGRITAHDVAYFLMMSLADERDGKRTFKDEDYYKLQARLPFGEQQRFSFYNTLYFAFAAVYSKARGLMEVFNSSVGGFVDNLQTRSSLIQIEATRRSYTCVFSPDEYKAMREAAKKTVEEDIERAIYIILLAMFDASKTRNRFKECWVEKEAAKYDIPLEPDKYPFLTLPVYRLKKSGALIHEFYEPEYIEELEALAIAATGDKDIDNYYKHIDDDKLSILFVDGRAVRELAKRKTGIELNYSDKQLTQLLQDSIACDEIIKYRDVDILLFEEALGYLPACERVGTTTDFDPDNDHRLGAELSFYLKDKHYSDTEKMDNFKAYLPALYGMIKEKLTKGAADNFTGFSDYIVYLLSQVKLSPARATRLRLGGAAISTNPDYKENIDDVLFNSNPEALRKAPQRNLTMFKALAYANAFNHLVDIVAELYEYPDLPKFAKIDFSYYETIRKSFNDSLFWEFYYLNYLYEGEELEEQRSRLGNAFPFLYLITFKYFEPSKESVSAAKTKLTELVKAKDPDGAIRLLEDLSIKPMLDSIYWKIS